VCAAITMARSQRIGSFSLGFDLAFRSSNDLILMAAVSVIVGDYAAKAWSFSHGQREWYLLLAFAGYFFSGFFYVPSLLREGLIITSVLWVLLSAVRFLVIGIVIFKETLSLTQTVGVILGIISVLLLTISGH
jgi:multidrug transporter EmrE-like cation transporter